MSEQITSLPGNSSRSDGIVATIDACGEGAVVPPGADALGATAVGVAADTDGAFEGAVLGACVWAAGDGVVAVPPQAASTTAAATKVNREIGITAQPPHAWVMVSLKSRRYTVTALPTHEYSLLGWNNPGRRLRTVSA